MIDTIVRSHTFELMNAHMSPGVLMPIGGAESKAHHPDILRTFVRLAGGDQARIALIPSASDEPDDAIATYTEAFRELGVEHVDAVQGETRRAFDLGRNVEILAQATAIFISGGDQNVLAERLLGTRSAACILERNANGVVVAGTSAGAAIMASHMVGGGESGATPLKSMSSVSEGLGLIRNVIIDTHFGERGRTGRLMAMHAAHVEVVSIGLDENTAAIIDGQMVMSVIGEGAVTILDGSSIRSDIDLLGGDEPVMISGAELHTVTAKYEFDIRARKFVPPLRATRSQGQ